MVKPMGTPSCDNAPWWSAPVIVGGSGGAGTRGVVILLERLGVRMACIGEPSLFNKVMCNMTCNSAADSKFLSSFRTPSPYSLSFLHTNHTRGPDGRRVCGADKDLLRLASDVPVANGCGGTKARAMHLMRDAVRPQYRRPLRWGMKNPHATYYVNALQQLFPCMVMVNTVRDLMEMGRGMKHFYSRVQEARSLGMISHESADRMSSGVPNKRAVRTVAAASVATTHHTGHAVTAAATQRESSNWRPVNGSGTGKPPILSKRAKRAVAPATTTFVSSVIELSELSGSSNVSATRRMLGAARE